MNLARRLIYAIVLVTGLVLEPLPASGGTFREDQVTTQELAAALGINTRKLIFTFDKPAYAKADFVRVDSGQAVHSANSSQKAAVKIPFYYIIHSHEPQGKMITFKIGDSGVYSIVQPRTSPSARVHDAYPEIVIPATLDPKKPIYVFLDWDPEIDATLNREMPGEEIASKMKQGYYLTVSFAETPFTKP